MLGKRNPSLVFAQAKNSNFKIANFSKINWKSSTSQIFCLKDQFWTSDFPQRMLKEQVFKNILVHYWCTNTYMSFNKSLGSKVIEEAVPSHVQKCTVLLREIVGDFFTIINFWEYGNREQVSLPTHKNPQTNKKRNKTKKSPQILQYCEYL